MQARRIHQQSDRTALLRQRSSSGDCKCNTSTNSNVSVLQCYRIAAVRIRLRLTHMVTPQAACDVVWEPSVHQWLPCWALCIIVCLNYAVRAAVRACHASSAAPLSWEPFSLFALLSSAT